MCQIQSQITTDSHLKIAFNSLKLNKEAFQPRAGDSQADSALEANFDLLASTDDCIGPYLAMTSGKSSDALPSSTKGEARQAEKSRLQSLLHQFAQKAVKGCPCVYFKEGTSERCQSRYRMDRLLETLMLVNGQDPGQLEISCPVIAIQDIYTMAEDGPGHFPQRLWPH